ncbi:MAG: AAA family ATPase [Candidatus Aureabacteria bacterium]|nr:AAA family ATPase [Candidatus Auribacterota bacterium]
MSNPVFLRRVILKNYKSIASCSVNLGPLNFLVGANGAGKSNFLDALRFVSESLNSSLDHALRERGGIAEVRRRTSGRSGHPTHFRISLRFCLPDDTKGLYAFRVGSRKKGSFEVQEEECHVYKQALEERFFKVESGHVVDSKASVKTSVMPPASDDRLYLVAAAGLPDFRPIYDALFHMGFYNLNPDKIRELQTPDAGELLRRDGGNLASVLDLMKKENKISRQRVVEFLSKVVPGVQDVMVKRVGKKETLEFHQVGSNETPWRFTAENMSDGTLRALGVLTALFQSANGGAKRIPLVGIEEPEMAVHPGAAGVLRDALSTAAERTQVVATSHSPDLLDDKSIHADSILVVLNVNGETEIGPLKETDRSAILDHLCTAGELLRTTKLEPDLQSSTPDLFEEMP